MNASEAVVTRLEGPYAWLEILDRPAGCGKCESAGGCGGKGTRQRVLNTVDARVGDHVTVSVPDGAVLRAAAASYLLPLVLLLAGALVGGLLGGDPFAVIGALVGLGGGWAGLACIGRRSAASREPLLQLRIKPVAIRLHRNQEP